ncbi:MAG: hypothetical protein FWF11_01760, partial [Coriobacteriia bacterium]|nr:hypothetical protein [Coriobacteriia bacterium]
MISKAAIRLLSVLLCAALILPFAASLVFANEGTEATSDAAPAFALEDSSTAIADKHNNQVILLLAPFLQWEDITPETTPHLWAVLQDAAIGNLNARSRVKEADGAPSLAEGALTISAGTWPLVAHQALPAFQINDVFGDAS